MRPQQEWSLQSYLRLNRSGCAKHKFFPAKHSDDFKLLYELDGNVQDRMDKIARDMYGAEKVEFSEVAQKKVDMYEKQGFGNLDSNHKIDPKQRFAYPMLNINGL